MIGNLFCEVCRRKFQWVLPKIRHCEVSVGALETLVESLKTVSRALLYCSCSSLWCLAPVCEVSSLYCQRNSFRVLLVYDLPKLMSTCSVGFNAQAKSVNISPLLICRHTSLYRLHCIEARSNSSAWFDLEVASVVAFVGNSSGKSQKPLYFKLVYSLKSKDMSSVSNSRKVPSHTLTKVVSGGSLKE